MKKFFTKYETKNEMGWARYDSENEMYADLEVQNIVEENPDVIGITYFEIDMPEDVRTQSKIVRRWSFGKPLASC